MNERYLEDFVAGQTCGDSARLRADDVQHNWREHRPVTIRIFVP